MGEDIITYFFKILRILMRLSKNKGKCKCTKHCVMKSTTTQPPNPPPPPTWGGEGIVEFLVTKTHV